MNLINVLSDTLNAWENGYYECNNKKISLRLPKSTAESSVVFLPDKISEMHQKPLVFQELDEHGIIKCVRMDSFSCASNVYQELSNQKKSESDKKILVLNFANPIHPGGGIRRGAMAQEEDLCRRSSLLLALENSATQDYYEFNSKSDRFLSSDAMILTPKVEIIKDEDYTPLPETITISVITCAAPIFDKDYVDKNIGTKQYYNLFYKRIQSMLRISAYCGYQNLILGAWGCGAFGNDAKIVSDLFLQALEEKDISGISMKDYFRSVHFAVPGKFNSYNYNEFYRNFGSCNSKKKKHVEVPQMNDKRTSPSTQSIFVIPVGDEVELYLEYNGLQWSNDSINEEKLRSFSENCQGIHITFLDAENGKLLLFSQKEDMEDSIKIYFERIFSEQLPCAFFDKLSKTYDNFEVSSQVAQMTVCFMEDGKIDVEWQYEEDEISGPDVVDPVPTIPQPPFPTHPEPTTPGNNELEELEKRNRELSFQISNYKMNEDSLSKKIAELQEENERLKAVSGGNAVNDGEIDRLKTLVTQLLDSHFDDSYVHTHDASINELTASIASRRKTLAEKEASLHSLEQEESEVEHSIADIKQNITNAMDNIHKAERIKQEQSVELSDIQASLQQILAEIDMDIDTLEMYSEHDSLSTVVSEAKDAKNMIEEKLKSFIVERQKDCEERRKRIQTS